MNRLLHLVNRIASDVRSDQALLVAFATNHDGDALAELFRRHAPAVRRVAADVCPATAEEVVQAAFTLLAERAGTLTGRTSAAGWLFQTARRLALKTRTTSARRTRHEASAPPPSPPSSPLDDLALREVQALVAEELAELPERLGVPLVLHYWEGTSHAEAAARLGCSVSTLKRLLDAGRERLGARLARRGLSGAAVLTVLTTLQARVVARPGAGVVPGELSAPLHAALGASVGGTGVAKGVTVAVCVLAVGAALALGLVVQGERPRPPAVTTAQTTAHMSALVAATPPGVRKVSGPEQSLITPDTRKAIAAGLDYLAKNQAEDGSWVTGDYRGTVASTALAGRVFLAAGYEPGQGPTGERLTKAIEYILKNEDGGLLAKGKSAPMYEHGFAVHFLAEAYGKVTDKALKDRMKATLTRAVKAIADGQHHEGGWRYQPKPRAADLTVTCCQLHALAAAKRAGFEIPQATIDNGIKYVLSCRDLAQIGGFRYIPSVGTASFGYTAAAISALNAVGFKGDREVGDKEVLENGTEFIRSFKPGDSNVHFYEARSDAAPVMKATGGKDWEAWYSAVRDDLLDRRNKDGVWDGGVWDPKGSSHFNTALAVIILQTAK